MTNLSVYGIIVSETRGAGTPKPQRGHFMNALEKIFINKSLAFAVDTLANENFGFKKIRATKYAKGFGCAAEMSKFSSCLDKMQIIIIYANDDSKVTKVDYFSEEC